MLPHVYRGEEVAGGYYGIYERRTQVCSQVRCPSSRARRDPAPDLFNITYCTTTLCDADDLILL
jgi:hypothetical protein